MSLQSSLAWLNRFEHAPSRKRNGRFKVTDNGFFIRKLLNKQKIIRNLFPINSCAIQHLKYEFGHNLPLAFQLFHLHLHCACLHLDYEVGIIAFGFPTLCDFAFLHLCIFASLLLCIWLSLWCRENEACLQALTKGGWLHPVLNTIIIIITKRS